MAYHSRGRIASPTPWRTCPAKRASLEDPQERVGSRQQIQEWKCEARAAGRGPQPGRAHVHGQIATKPRDPEKTDVNITITGALRRRRATGAPDTCRG